jgi:hypothetical protein
MSHFVISHISFCLFLYLYTDMSAIYEAFNDQEIACDDLVVQDFGCENRPVNPPSVSATSDNKSVELSWSTVANAVSYDIMRAEGGCQKGKVKVASISASGQLSFRDNGLKNGFEVSDPQTLFHTKDFMFHELIRRFHRVIAVLLPHCSKKE